MNTFWISRDNGVNWDGSYHFWSEKPVFVNGKWSVERQYMPSATWLFSLYSKQVDCIFSGWKVLPGECKLISIKWWEVYRFEPC